MAPPATLAPAPAPVPVVPAVLEAAVPAYSVRFWSELTSRPLRLAAALVVTALAPVLVFEVTVAGRSTAELSRSPAARPGPPGEGVVTAVPVAGDERTWRAGAHAAAATCPGLPAEVLVAIGRVETGLGIRVDASHAGAIGPMQFLPATWSAYGADGDGDGRADVMNPLDALHGAARLLCANGGGDPHRLRSALWNYNHSTSYVDEVARIAGLTPV